MKMLIRGRGIEIDRRLRAHLERRLEFALGRFAPRLDRVEVRLSDVNGPRGGLDTRCAIRLVWRGGETALVEALQAGPFSAADEAVDRAREHVARRLDRQRRPRGPSAAEVPFLFAAQEDAAR